MQGLKTRHQGKKQPIIGRRVPASSAWDFNGDLTYHSYFYLLGEGSKVECSWLRMLEM